METNLNILEARKGEWFLLSSVVMWSFFPVITLISVSQVPPIFAAAGSTLFAAIFFAIVLTVQKKWQEFKIAGIWGDMFLSAFLIGILFYGLFFLGAGKTTAGNAAIVGLTEVFFSFLFLSVLSGKEKFVWYHFLGALLSVFGAFLIVFSNEFRVDIGALIIIAGFAFTPFGNYFQKRVRQKISSISLMFFRSIVSCVFFFVLSFYIETTPSEVSIKETLIFLAINGVFLFGISKIFWLEAIHRIPITKANALGVGTPLLTLIVAYLVLNEIPTLLQILGFFPILIGTLLILRKK